MSNGRSLVLQKGNVGQKGNTVFQWAMEVGRTIEGDSGVMGERRSSRGAIGGKNVKERTTERDSGVMGERRWNRRTVGKREWCNRNCEHSENGRRR